MFRASVHTSFVVDNVIRLARDELDGAAQNDKYPSDFFIDLIFTDARNQSNLLLSGTNLNPFAKGPELQTPCQETLFDFEAEERKLM